MIVIEGTVINNLHEACNWLKEAWIYEPYNIYLNTFNDVEYICVEPVNEDDYFWDIFTLEEFKKFVKTRQIKL